MFKAYPNSWKPDSSRCSEPRYAKVDFALLLLFCLSLAGIWVERVNAETSGDYRINIGDTLLIAVIEHSDYNQSVKVREDGKISYFGGDLSVVGKTPEEVHQGIYEILSRRGQLKAPIVMVSPIPRENEIFVGGAVKNPGRYLLPFQGETGLYQAITLAGGASELADLKRVQVVRPGGTVEKYDLSPGNSYQSIPVKVSDLVWIPHLGQVDVQGQVRTRGKILIQERIRLDHALARAGGPVYEESDLSEVVIVKSNGQTIELSVSEKFWRNVKDGDDRYYLEDGDVLYVPDAYEINKVYILGYVREPGPQKIRGPITPMQAIALAGGAEKEANIKKAKIIRKDGSIQQVNIKPYDAHRTNKSDVLLYGGDTLEIPKRFQINWSLVLSFISVTSVAIGIITRN